MLFSIFVLASFYHEPQPQACGGRFNPEAMTAAHKTLPCGTLLRVTNPRNYRSVVVKITDRGPYIKGRSLDLSLAAARQLGMLDAGVIIVEIEHISNLGG